MRVCLVGGHKSHANAALGELVTEAGHELVLHGNGHDALVFTVTSRCGINSVISEALSLCTTEPEKFILNVMTEDGEYVYTQDETRNLIELGKMVQEMGGVFVSGFEAVMGSLEIRQHKILYPVPEPADWTSHRFQPTACSDEQLRDIREARQKFTDISFLVKSQWPEAVRIVDKLEEACMLTVAAIARN